VNEVTLYTKSDCHLCQAVGQVIARAARQRAFGLAVRDITQDAADFEKYATEIPVVLVNGREIARFRLDLADLIKALDEAGSEN